MSSGYVPGGYTDMVNDMNEQYSEQDLNRAIQKDFYSQLNAAANNLVNQSGSGGTETVNPRDNRTDKTTISMTDYDDNHSYDVTVVGTAGDDNFNNHGDCSKIYGGAGDDTIKDTANYVSVFGGAGNDIIIEDGGANCTSILGGKGDDSISLDRYNDDLVVIYANGDGDDTVSGWNVDDTLYIEGSYTRETIDSSVVFHVGNGSITFTDIVSKSPVFEDSYYVKNINVETVPAGTFSSVTEPVYTAPTSTTTTDTSSTSSSGSSSSSTSGSSSSSVTSDGPYTTRITGNSSTSTTTGNDKVISNYTGEPVTVSGSFMGAAFSGNSFVVNSSAGTLTIQNVTDKVVDLRNSAGGEFIKAYQASSAGGIDGRGINAYEIIEGSAAGTDVIFAGDGGSQLWGGNGMATDALVGGNGSDIFIGGRYQGNDIFFNASSADAVNLTDTSLSDIVAAVESGGTIAIAFNTGNAITIQSTELLSAAINLADGSSWRYNQATKSWQGA